MAALNAWIGSELLRRCRAPRLIYRDQSDNALARSARRRKHIALLRRRELPAGAKEIRHNR